MTGCDGVSMPLGTSSGIHARTKVESLIGNGSGGASGFESELEGDRREAVREAAQYAICSETWTSAAVLDAILLGDRRSYGWT